MRPPSLSVAPVYYATANPRRTFTGPGIPGRTTRPPQPVSPSNRGGLLASTQAYQGFPYGAGALVPTFPNNRSQPADQSAPGGPPASGGCVGCGS